MCNIFIPDISYLRKYFLCFDTNVTFSFALGQGASLYPQDQKAIALPSLPPLAMRSVALLTCQHISFVPPLDC